MHNKQHRIKCFSFMKTFLSKTSLEHSLWKQGCTDLFNAISANCHFNPEYVSDTLTFLNVLELCSILYGTFANKFLSLVAPALKNLKERGGGWDFYAVFQPKGIPN